MDPSALDDLLTALPPATWLGAALAFVALLAALAAGHRALRRRLAQAAGDDPQSTAAEPPPAGMLTQSRFHRELLRRAETGAAHTLLFVNLDSFRTVNDAWDNRVGDRVLAELARRLAGAAGAGGCAACRGGDEFMLLLPLAVEAARAQADQLVAELRAPFDVPGGKGLVLSASIGVACLPEHGPPESLVSHADLAMREVKKNGGDGWSLFEPRMVLGTREQAELLRDLRGALAAGQLELFYQPKIDAQSLQVTAAEALLRWRHPQRGLVSPSVFVPVAERFGLIAGIGQWVIREACAQAARWRTAGLRMRVAINVSAHQLRSEKFVDELVKELKRHKLQPARFTVEITETVAMEDTDATQRAFRQLGAAGLHVSIDDFGVGQASLSYLRRLPASELKIDSSFVADLAAGEQARKICRAVIDLGHALKMRVVAEGVETPAQRDALLAMGCDELQGFLFAKPMSARALGIWAMDDAQRHESPAFRSSLFKETVPMS